MKRKAASRPSPSLPEAITGACVVELIISSAVTFLVNTAGNISLRITDYD